MANNYFQTTLRNLRYRLRSLKDQSALTYAIMKAVQDNEEFILDIVRWDQLYARGINGKGVEIASYMPYTTWTKINKAEKLQPTDRVTLRDTGHFYNMMEVVVTTKGFYIQSEIAYTHELIDKYGKEIFRITNENFNKIVVPLIRIAAFDFIFKQLKMVDDERALELGLKLKRRLKADYRSLIEYTNIYD